MGRRRKKWNDPQDMLLYTGEYSSNGSANLNSVFQFMWHHHVYDLTLISAGVGDGDAVTEGKKPSQGQQFKVQHL